MLKVEITCNQLTILFERSCTGELDIWFYKFKDLVNYIGKGSFIIYSWIVDFPYVNVAIFLKLLLRRIFGPKRDAIGEWRRIHKRDAIGEWRRIHKRNFIVCTAHLI